MTCIGYEFSLLKFQKWYSEFWYSPTNTIDAGEGILPVSFHDIGLFQCQCISIEEYGWMCAVVSCGINCIQASVVCTFIHIRIWSKSDIKRRKVCFVEAHGTLGDSTEINIAFMWARPLWNAKGSLNIRYNDGNVGNSLKSLVLLV